MTLVEFYNKWSDFTSLVEATLSRQDESMDRREGSVLYDFAALTDNEISNFAVAVRELFEQMFLETSTGTYLESHAARRGITRYSATACSRKGNFYFSNGQVAYPNIPFDTVWQGQLSDGSRGTWLYKERIDDIDDYEVFTSQITGTIPNGGVLTLTNSSYPDYTVTLHLPPLAYGENVETDDALLKRVQTVEKTPPFGGNITQYKEAVEAIDGVGYCQVYPAYRGGGTVLLSVSSPELNSPAIESWLVSQIKEYIDPADATGEGKGYAPIGHSVDVQSVTSETVKFTIDDVVIGRSYQEENVRQAIKTAITNYFTDIQQNWSTFDPVSFDYRYNITLNQLEYIVMSVDGVIDVMGTITTFVNGTSQGTTGYTFGMDANEAFKQPVFDSTNTIINFRARS